MTDRDRIAEIIRNARMFADPLSQVGYAEADALLANGVIVPPCKVGDYVLWNNGIETQKKEVINFYYDPSNLGLRYVFRDFAPVVNHTAIVGIITKEEAEQALKEREGK